MTLVEIHQDSQYREQGSQYRDQDSQYRDQDSQYRDWDCKYIINYFIFMHEGEHHLIQINFIEFIRI